MADGDLGIEGITDATVVGQGGFGTVYRAEQPAFRRTVAVKVLHAPDQDEAARQRFRRECQAMGSLADHPNIVTLYDAGFLDDGRAFIVMAYMGGGSLHERAATPGSMPWPEIAATGIKLAGALETAHRAGILHRDLKPANVLISSFGEPQLTDFGIARIAGGHETRSGVVTASLPYAPPEILDGRPPTVASDVYGLAATLVHLAIGRPPFTEQTDEGNAPILRRVYVDQVPDLSPWGVPPPVASVLRAAMTKDPASRIPTAQSLGQALQSAERELGRPATRMQIEGADPTPATRTVAPPTPAPAAPPPPPPPAPGPARPTPGTPPAPPSRSRARPWLIGAAVAVVAALVVGGVVLAARSGSDDGPRLGGADDGPATTGAPPSTSTGAPSTIALGDTVSGDIPPGDVVLHRFEGAAGDTVAAFVSASTAQRRVSLLDPDGRRRVLADERCFAGVSDQTVLTAGLPVDGTYTFEIDGGGDGGTYSMATVTEADIASQTPFVTATVTPRRPDDLSRFYGFSADGDLVLTIAEPSGQLVAHSDDCAGERDPVIAGASSGGELAADLQVFGDLPAGTTLGLLDATAFAAAGTLPDAGIIGLAADLQAGETWQITARSADNDAFLSLIDPGGIEVATDDDSAGGLDATISYDASIDGVHEVVLSFLGPDGGSFTVDATVQ